MSIQRAILVSPKRWEGPFDQDGTSGIVRISLGYKDFVVAATTANYDIANWPGGVLVEDVFGVLRQDFTGGAVSAATLSVGDTSDVDRFAVATSVFTGAPILMWDRNAAKGVDLIAPNTAFISPAATAWAAGTLRIQMLTTTANANALTAGKLDLFLKLRAVSLRT